MSTTSTKKCPHKGKCLQGCEHCNKPKCKEARTAPKGKKKCPKKGKGDGGSSMGGEGGLGQGYMGVAGQGHGGLGQGGLGSGSQGFGDSDGKGGLGKGSQRFGGPDGRGNRKSGLSNCHCKGKNTGEKCSICGHEPGGAGGLFACWSNYRPLMVFTIGSFLTMRLALVAAELG